LGSRHLFQETSVLGVVLEPQFRTRRQVRQAPRRAAAPIVQVRLLPVSGEQLNVHAGPLPHVEQLHDPRRIDQAADPAGALDRGKRMIQQSGPEKYVIEIE
jgi:hypothetical protein